MSIFVTVPTGPQEGGSVAVRAVGTWEAGGGRAQDVSVPPPASPVAGARVNLSRYKSIARLLLSLPCYPVSPVSVF